MALRAYLTPGGMGAFQLSDKDRDRPNPRAAAWRDKRALFETALSSASPAVEIGKLFPLKL